MIPHTHKKWPSGQVSTPDQAQSQAEMIGRQEVSALWFLESMPDAPVWRWVPDKVEFGLDPWRFEPEFDVNKRTGESIPPMRLFVQIKDIPGDLTAKQALSMSE